MFYVITTQKNLLFKLLNVKLIILNTFKWGTNFKLLERKI